jgi:hypothetical protein
MTDALVTDSLNRVVDLDELRQRVTQLQSLHSMRVITDLSCTHPWLPDTPRMRARINSVNLSLLAKALVLWSDPNGRPLTITGDESSDERIWMLRAVNSLQWYSRDEFENDRDNTLVAYLVRQAYMVYSLNDPVDGIIGRNFLMFHELIREVDVPVKALSSELRRVIGVGYEDLWAVLYCVYAYYFLLHKQDPSNWAFTTTFFSDTPRNDYWNGALAAILTRIARNQDQLRGLYASEPKYRDESGRTGAWLTEFNLLRDFPVVEVKPGLFTCPFPPFVFQRAAVGFYYDLLFDYEEQERRRGSTNPARNPVRQTFQMLFQRYVGLQLEQLPGSDKHLSAEFKYGTKKLGGDSPDWLLTRPGRLPTFFECKGRRPALVWQSQAQPNQLDRDIRQTIAYAMNQISTFLKWADQGMAGLEAYKGIKRAIFALVMHDPFPFHAIPDVAARIEQVAKKEAPDWAAVAPRLIFVPMSIRELETAVGLELQKGIPVETQFEEYANYRSTARRVEFVGGSIRLPRHLEEFLQEKWNDSNRITNPLIERTWDRFADFVSRRIYGESVEDYEAELRRRWVAENAYFRWLNEQRPEGRALPHWLDAEREYRELEQRLGMPPYEAERLARYTPDEADDE